MEKVIEKLNVEEVRLLRNENDRLRAEVEKLRLVRDAAHDWWLGKRPVGWGREQHHANPEINTTSLRERRLAEACAALDAAKGG